MNTLIKNTVDKTFRSHGFHKKSGTWYRESEETMLVANLQKSQYSEVYYINIGVWVKALGGNALPKEHQCHIRVRLGSLAGKQSDKALNADDTSVSETERVVLILASIEQFGIPFMIANSSIPGIRNQLDSGNLSKALVHVKVKELVSSGTRDKWTT